MVTGLNQPMGTVAPIRDLPKDERTPQQICKEGGGFWDVETQTCVKVPPKATPTGDKKFGDIKTGEVTTVKGGVTQQKVVEQPGSGKWIGGKEVSPEYYKNQQETGRMEAEGGHKTITPEEMQQQQARQQAIQQMGLNPQEIAALQGIPLTEASTNWSQALTAGTISNVPGLIKSIGTGAIGGAIAGGGVASVPLGILGGIGGAIVSIWGGVRSDIKKQKMGEIGASKDVLTNAKTNMMKLSRLASMDPGSAQEISDDFEYWQAQVHLAQRQIKLETQGDLNGWIEDGRDILSDFDLFLGPSGTSDIYRRRIIAQLNQEVSPEQMAMWAMEDLDNE